jgi:protein SCO1/2
MRPVQKRITIALWALVVLAIAGIVVGKFMLSTIKQMQELDRAQSGTSELFAAPPIALMDENGKPFNTAELHGHPWIADFVFTSCGSVCPIMTAKMVELQKNTPEAVHLVSFTVDPKNDTPVILTEYGKSFHADFARWHFLTGTVVQMADAAYQMKVSVKPASADSAIMHSEKFLLVDPEGSVVGIYNGTNADEVKRLTTDAARLAQLAAVGMAK